jgi:uncharacterized protein (TIGR03437 family)
MTKSKTFLYAMAFSALAFLVSAQASAQTISIVSGNGQLVCTLCFNTPGGAAFDPLVVQVKDAVGNPVVGATVTWNALFGTGASGTLSSATTVTAADGTTSNTFFMASPFGGFSPYLQATVTASIPSSSVAFTESSAGSDPSTGVSLIIATLVSPPVGTSFSGAAGTVDTTNPVKINLFASRGGFIPGVEMKLLQPAGQTSTVSCASGTGAGTTSVLTDAAGNATCNVFFGGRPGTGTFAVTIGGKYATFGGSSPFTFTVTSGLPGLIVITTGNNQQGNAGSLLPAPLVAIVQDLAGNTLPDVGVTWTVSPANGASLTNTRTTTDPNGRVSTNVVLGSTPGAVLIKAAISSNSNVSATFTATVLVSITALQKLAGEPQDAAINTPFTQPLVVQVNNGAAPVAGVTVNFAVTSGNGSVVTPNAVTDANGRAQTLVQAGAIVGPLTVTASVTGFTPIVTFNLTVRLPGPSISSNNFFNAASGQRGAISPCSVATMVGTGLATGIQGAVVPTYPGPWPMQVANVTVTFRDNATTRDLAAPIYSVVNINSQESVNFEIPCDLTPGTTQVTVRVGNGSATISVPVQVAAPGIFETVLADGTRRAAVVKADGTLVTPGNPARKGDTLRMYVTGVGPVTPLIGTNQVGIQDLESSAINSVIVGVGNEGVQVISVRYARGLVGVYEVEFVVPDFAVTRNDSPLAIAVVVGGQFIFGAGSTLAVF